MKKDGSFSLVRNQTGRFSFDGFQILLCLLSAATATPFVTSAQQTQVKVWGLNHSGQFDVPPTLTNAVAISAAGYFTMALRADGTVDAWGNGYAAPGFSNVVMIAAAWTHGLMLLSDGSVAGFGNGYNLIPTNLNNVVGLAGGWYCSLALQADGTAQDWGSGTLAVPPGVSNLVAIAAGGNHAAGLLSDGTVVEWGNPAGVPTGLSNIVAIACGEYHSVALHYDGTVTDWGSSGSNNPGLSNVVAIAAGGGHSLALHSDGTVSSWGSLTTVPPDVTNAVAVAAGGGDGLDHSVALIGPLTNPTPSLGIRLESGIIRVHMAGEIRRLYVLEEATQLSPQPNWAFKTNIRLTNSLQSVLEILAPGGGGPRFYRARLTR